jgi:hypothetical protein
MFFISLMIENILVMIDSYDKGNSIFFYIFISM